MQINIIRHKGGSLQCRRRQEETGRRQGTVLCLLPGGRIEETENRPLSPCLLQDKMEVFLILWQNLQQEVITYIWKHRTIVVRT